MDDKTAADVFCGTLKELALTELLPNETVRTTKLFHELNIDLQLAFMGMLEPWEIILALQDGNLIPEKEAAPERLITWNRIGSNPDKPARSP